MIFNINKELTKLIRNLICKYHNLFRKNYCFLSKKLPNCLNIVPYFLKSIAINLLILTLVPINSYAGGVGSSMEKFWQEVGGSYGNGSDGAAYQTQGAGYYTLGGFSGRTKVADVNPLTITPPGIRAGCGGIDAYMGAFSHINADQFIALLKAIPANALGFAFQLALATVSPQIETNIAKLQAIIEKVNSMNMNSCDMAQGLVGGALALAGKNQAYCETTANSQGWATDFARSRMECGSGGKSSEHIKDANSVHGDQRPVDVNIAWEVLKKSQLVNKDLELSEFIQTLTGTIIIKTPTDDSKGPETIYKTNLIVKNDLIKAILDGGEMKIITCDEADKCLNPSEKNVKLPENQSFRKRINNLITQIAEKIKDKDGALTPEEKDLITKTSIPLYSSMVAKQAYFKNSLANSRDAELYTEVIAIDILYNYLDEILKSVEEQSKQVTNFNQENIDKFIVGIQKARKEIVQFKTDNRESLDVAIKILKNQRMIEEILSENMSSSVKGNVLWANQF